jgi:hypothetical protein
MTHGITHPSLCFSQIRARDGKDFPAAGQLAVPPHAAGVRQKVEANRATDNHPDPPRPLPYGFGRGVVATLGGRIGSTTEGCSPLRDPRNDSILPISSSLSFAPSWLLPMIATA